jgi:diadenosine tetraphosphate (Ap4A) HIT family hydrolase
VVFWHGDQEGHCTCIFVDEYDYLYVHIVVIFDQRRTEYLWSTVLD